MRKFTQMIIFLMVLILIIPAFALIGGDKSKGRSDENGNIIFEDNKNTQPKQNPSTDKIDKAEHENNNFYIIKNAKTNEVFELTPSDYIKGVVAAEMPIEFSLEALKAQAVAAHTYALLQIDNELKSPSPELQGAYLSTDSNKFQAFVSKDELKTKWGDNFDINYKKLSEAVDSVINKVITFNNAPIAAAFHSVSSGKTESAKNVWGQEISYLTPVVSDGDELSPVFEGSVTLTEQEVTHALMTEFPDIKFSKDRSKWFQIVSRSESNSIIEIKVGSIKTTGQKIRELLRLKSASFSVAYADKSFTFTTAGYGHGVGMSQYGADYMARQGSDYNEILLHYYNGVTIDEIVPDLQTGK